jgi:hypothetical protein
MQSAEKPKPAILLPVPDDETITMVFPDQPATEAPPTAKLFSDRNLLAANPQANRDTAIPQLNGRQTDVPQAQDVPRKQIAKPQPMPAPKAEDQPEEMRTKPMLQPGDLALGKPLDSPPRKESEVEQPRPRTIREALVQQNALPSVQMRQDGGVRRHAIVPSFDTKVTGFAEYDRRFTEAVRQRWYDLLDSQNFALDRVGKVTLHFRLNYNGTVSDMNFGDNTVGDLLGYVCQKAVQSAAPYEHFPSDMRYKLGDFVDVQFTFYYIRN